jgi:mono/diheme cytochrome c family protein
MINAIPRSFAMPLKLLPLALLAFAYGCEQPAPDAEPATPAPAEQPQVMERGVQSIDADGNVAPFGMASKQPVPVEQSEVIIVADTGPASALFATNCSACHGADAMGVEGLGLNLVESQLVAESSEGDLVVFLKAGRQPGSPDSVTGVPMPAFAWMSDADLAAISGYLKSL